MADTKISGLSEVTSLLSTDEFVLARSGASNKVTAVNLQTSLAPNVFTYVVKTADEAVSSNTTPQDDDELFFTAANGVTYEVEVLLIYASPAGTTTPDMKVVWGEDTTERGYGFSQGVSTGEAVQFDRIRADRTITNTYGTTGTKRSVIAKMFYTGAGGTFRVQWAQNTSNGNDTIVYASSYLKYRVIA